MTEGQALGGGAVGRLRRRLDCGEEDDPDRPSGCRFLVTRLRTAARGVQYEIVEAKDGMEAVELAGTIASPGMVVSDTTMPRVDGFTLAKILRQNPIMKKVPIMFVSAQHSPQHVTQALVIGVSQYLPKSTPVPQIIEKIRKIVV